MLADGAIVCLSRKCVNRKTSERYGATSALFQHGHDTLHAAWAFCSKPHAAYAAHAARRPVKAQPRERAAMDISERHAAVWRVLTAR